MEKAIEVINKILNQHLDEVWEYYEQGYWSKDDFRFGPENGDEVIDGFRKWDFDEYLNGAYHYGFVLGLEMAIRHIGYEADEADEEVEMLKSQIQKMWDGFEEGISVDEMNKRIFEEE